MRSGMTRGLLGLLLLVGAGASLVAWRAQDAPPDRPIQSNIADRIDERVKKLEATVAEQKAELERLGRLAAGIAAGAAELGTATEQARANGFEQAGANPLARTRLLEGLTGFSEAVKQALAPPKPEPAAKK